MLSRCSGYRQLLLSSGIHRALDGCRGSSLLQTSKGTTSLCCNGWADLLSSLGCEELPDRLVLLNGAPGSGKTKALDTVRAFSGIQNAESMSSAIAKHRKIKADTLKSMSGLAGDDAACSAVLSTLRSAAPLGSAGRELIIDGFPRSDSQVTFLEELIQHVQSMRARQYGLARAELDVCMVVLHVDEATSIQRQQARQLQAESHNAAVRSSGEGSLMEERITDQSATLCRERFAVFAKSMPALTRMERLMNVYHIDASGPADNCSYDVASALIQHREQHVQSAPHKGTFQNQWRVAPFEGVAVSPWWATWPKWFAGAQVEDQARKHGGVVLNRGGWAPHGVVWA